MKESPLNLFQLLNLLYLLYLKIGVSQIDSFQEYPPQLTVPLFRS
jgi:hypothetical protein